MGSLLQKASSVYTEEGLAGAARKSAQWLVFWAVTVPRKTVLHYIYKTFRRPHRRTFVFDGKNLEYFYHRYNFTWANERIAEIAIAKDFLDGAHGKILEVGNVLSHYFPTTHEILDKYEPGEGIIHEDIADFEPKEKYDAILCVSTLEHVGWDYFENKESGKVLQAAENLVRCLKSPGRMLITMPLGYNSEVDRSIEERTFPFTRTVFLKRISSSNEWREVPYEEARGTRYDAPYFAANAIVVAFVEK